MEDSELGVPDFTMCADPTETYIGLVKSRFAPSTTGNIENLPPTNTGSDGSKAFCPYVETSGRFSDLVVAGDRFPRLNQMGRGAFGTVYESQDPDSGQRVALKVMRHDLSDLEKRMFDREVEILVSVKHPTLLELRGFMPFSQASATNPPVIVTEFMAGGSLQTMISEARKGAAPSNWDDTRKWIVIYGTAAGMMTLQANDILHRDLKPDNVLLDEDLHPKVADFGLGKFASANQQQQSFDGGTPGFMAPEVYDGSYGFSGDVFSFGMLVYVTLTNNRPFAEKSHYLIAERVRRGDRPNIPSSVNPAYQQLIESCWDNIPDHRPTFENIVAALESPDFWTPSTDVVALGKYQAKILPDRAKSSPISRGLFGGHQDAIQGILAEVFKKDLDFLGSIAKHLSGKLPAQILLAKLLELAPTGQVPKELLTAAVLIMPVCIMGFVEGLISAFSDASPDLTGWLRANYQASDMVEGFSAFLEGSRKQQQQTTISQLTRLLKEAPQVFNCQEHWDSVVEQARAMPVGSERLSLPDSALYLMISPANIQACLE